MFFTKMHGTGNDFIVVDEWEGESVPPRQKADFVRKACDRHFGIGSDGAIFIQKSKTADANFVYYNPDGSRAEMCGNGIRCLAKYVHEHGRVRKDVMVVETLAGLKTLALKAAGGIVKSVRVDMGRPQITRGEAQVAGRRNETFVRQKVKIAGRAYTLTAVGMGNPHAVLYVKDVDNVDVRGGGTAIRYHRKVFPNGTNVHFIEKVGENEFRIRTYERGVEDETLACGTGICASAVAAVLNKKADIGKPMLFHARGGDITVELEGTRDDIRRAYMTGPVEEAFTGKISF